MWKSVSARRQTVKVYQWLPRPDHTIEEQVYVQRSTEGTLIRSEGADEYASS